MGSQFKLARNAATPSIKRNARPLLEALEDRLLLYSAYGGTWTYGSRITFSFMPDGTSIGGTPSVLFQTLNAKFATATWEAQFQKAAAVWQAVGNFNLALVSDNGAAEAVNGNQQDDSRFGDIRIGAVNLGSGALAETFLPPPFNGGTDAGDMFFNSTAVWQINSDYDLETVAIHEFGHALGLGESQITTACMYAYYNGIKQTLTTDDTTGIQSVWGARRYDQFNSNGQSNGTYGHATNITSYINSNGQIAIPSLDMTTLGQSEWFLVTVPSTTTGTMVTTMQSSNLSTLSPKLTVFNSSLGTLGTVNSTAFGATVSFTLTGVQPGQSYYVRANGMAGGATIGGYGLEVNFGNQSQAAIAPPNTVVLQQPDQGGGSQNTYTQLLQIGSLIAQGNTIGFTPPPKPPGSNASSMTVVSPSGTVAVGTVVQATSGVVNAPAAVSTSHVALATSSVQSNSAPAGSTPSLLQALDSVLMGWKPKNRF